ncbi:MAG: KH domain-containing protein, partial [Acidimicrobiales bacterium]
GDFEDDDAGNRISGGTPLAVVTYLVKSIAGDPGAVVINTEERNGAVRFRIHVAPDDMGRVIGRRGRVAQAIRTVVAAAGARDGVQTNVDIADD